MSSPMLETVAHAIDEFPVLGTPAEKLSALVAYAILAPSSHNSQPWLFRIEDDVLELYADRTRGLPVVDPDDRELIISCGAALGCLEVALHHFGYEGNIVLVADPQRPDLLARVELGEMRMPLPREHDLFHAMLTRKTHRFAFSRKVVEAELLDDLELTAATGGVWFEVLQAESRRQALVDLVSEADAVQMADPAFRRELALWMHPNRSRSQDGMPGAAFGYGQLASLAAPFVVRTFDVGGGVAARHRQLAEGSPVLAILGTEGETPQDWIRTGQVLTRILLRAEAVGVAASFLNQPVEVPSLRLRVAALLGRSGFPQLVLRMGHPERPGVPTPRRPAPEVMVP